MLTMRTTLKSQICPGHEKSMFSPVMSRLKLTKRLLNSFKMSTNGDRIEFERSSDKGDHGDSFKAENCDWLNSVTEASSTTTCHRSWFFPR